MVNIIKDYRARRQNEAMNELALDFEDQMVEYILALEAGTPGSGTANGGAGDILELSQSADGVGFSHTTGKPIGGNNNQAQAMQWVDDFFTDTLVKLTRANISVKGGGKTLGGSQSRFWAAIPVELYTYGLARHLENKGLSLEFTQQIVKELGIFGPMFKRYST